MMTESDIRKLLAKAELFRPTVELYDIDEIAGPRLVATVYGWQEPRGSYSEDYRADAGAWPEVLDHFSSVKDGVVGLDLEKLFDPSGRLHRILIPDREATIKAQVDVFLSKSEREHLLGLHEVDAFLARDPAP